MGRPVVLIERRREGSTLVQMKTRLADPVRHAQRGQGSVVLCLLIELFAAWRTCAVDGTVAYLLTRPEIMLRC